MGCSSSKPSDGTELANRPARPINVSAPIGGPVQVPPQYRDQSGRPIQHAEMELDGETLHAALNDMARYLGQKRQRVTLVTVGGAVNTILLRSRPSTHDVDFFLADASSSVHQTIHEAARYANRQRDGRLGANWLNNSTQVFMSVKLQQELFTEAVQQGAVVFEHQSLIVFAAPWQYALCGKLNRLCEDNPRSYDLADAVVYLHKYLEATKQRHVSAGQIQAWCQQYQKKWNAQVLKALNQRYRDKYGRNGVDLHV